MKCAGTRSAGNPHAACDVAGSGNGAMGRTEAPVLGESRWQQLLPGPTATAPDPDPTRGTVNSEPEIERRRTRKASHQTAQVGCGRSPRGVFSSLCVNTSSSLCPRVSLRPRKMASPTRDHEDAWLTTPQIIDEPFFWGRGSLDRRSNHESHGLTRMLQLVSSFDIPARRFPLPTKTNGEPRYLVSR